MSILNILSGGPKKGYLELNTYDTDEVYLRNEVPGTSYGTTFLVSSLTSTIVLYTSIEVSQTDKKIHGSGPVNYSMGITLRDDLFILADLSGNYVTGAIADRAFKTNIVSRSNNVPGKLEVHYIEDWVVSHRTIHHIGTDPVGFHLSGNFSGNQFIEVPIIL